MGTENKKEPVRIEFARTRCLRINHGPPHQTSLENTTFSLLAWENRYASFSALHGKPTTVHATFCPPGVALRSLESRVISHKQRTDSLSLRFNYVFRNNHLNAKRTVVDISDIYFRNNRVASKIRGKTNSLVGWRIALHTLTRYTLTHWQRDSILAITRSQCDRWERSSRKKNTQDRGGGSSDGDASKSQMEWLDMGGSSDSWDLQRNSSAVSVSRIYNTRREALLFIVGGLTQTLYPLD